MIAITNNPTTSPHIEAINLLSRQLLTWFKQIQELDHGDFPDGKTRAANLRKRCHAIEASIKVLEEKSQKPEVSSQNKEGANS